MLETVGAFTVGLLLLAVILLALTIILNIICGALGAVRFRRVLKASSRSPDAWLWIARTGLANWCGRRFDGEYGEYYQVSGLKVPIDIRDRIVRNRFYGA